MSCQYWQSAGIVNADNWWQLFYYGGGIGGQDAKQLVNLATWAADHFEVKRFTSASIFSNRLISSLFFTKMVDGQWTVDDGRWTAHPKRQLSIKVKKTPSIAQWSAHTNRFKRHRAVRDPFSQDICPNIYTQADRHKDTKEAGQFLAVPLISTVLDILSTHKLPDTGPRARPFVNRITAPALSFGPYLWARSRCKVPQLPTIATQAAWEELVPGISSFLTSSQIYSWIYTKIISRISRYLNQGYS